MKFPNAYSGVKKLFYAEIVSLIAEAVAVLAAFFLVLAGAGVVILAVPALTLSLISGFAMIVVFIMQLVGLVQGSRDSNYFRVALYLVLAAIAIGFISSLLQSFSATKNLPKMVFSVLDTFTTIANFFTIVWVIYGVADLAKKLNNKAQEEKGNKLAFYICILYSASVVLGFLPAFKATGALATVFAIFGFIAVVVELIIYINVLIYLHRATKMLAK